MKVLTWIVVLLYCLYISSMLKMTIILFIAIYHLTYSSCSDRPGRHFIFTSLQTIPNSWLKKRWPSRNCRTMDSPEGRLPSWQVNMRLKPLMSGYRVHETGWKGAATIIQWKATDSLDQGYHFHPRSPDWNEPAFLDVILNLGEEPRVPALDPLKLLGLDEKQQKVKT